MPGSEDGSISGRLEQLYARARQARGDAQQTAARTHVVLGQARAIRESDRQSQARAREVSELWLSEHRDLLQYSAAARLQARMASMPLIEQAKGILMAQCGWTAEQAFDALRQASQRSNTRVRDLAARIVATTAASGGRPTSGSTGRVARAQNAQSTAAVHKAARRRSAEKTG